MEEEKKDGKTQEVIQEETEETDEADTSSEIEFTAYIWKETDQESAAGFWSEESEGYEEESQQSPRN